MFQWPAAEPADRAGEGAARTQDHQQAGRHGLQVPPYAALAFFCWCRQYHPSLLLITALCLPHSHSPGSFLMVLTGPPNSGLDQRSASTSLIHTHTHTHTHKHAHIHTPTQVHTPTYTHRHLSMLTHTHTHTHSLFPLTHKLDVSDWKFHQYPPLIVHLCNSASVSSSSALHTWIENPTHPASCLPTQTHFSPLTGRFHPGVTVCHWQDVKVQVLTHRQNSHCWQFHVSLYFPGIAWLLHSSLVLHGRRKGGAVIQLMSPFCLMLSL